MPGDTFKIQHTNGISGFKDLTYQYYYPDPEDMMPAQKAYIKDYMQTLEDNLLSSDFDDPDNGYRKYLDMSSAIDFFLLNEFSKDIDAYRYSVYMYKNHEKDDNKIHLGPIWDFNLGYGNVDFGTERAEETDDWLYDKEGRRMFWFFRFLQDPEFAKHVNCQWQIHRLHGFTNENINKIIDDAVADMGAAADRNHYHWKTLGRYVWPNNFVGDTYAQEIDYLKTWAKGRAQWMDIHVPGNCQLSVSTEDLEVAAVNDLKVYPNPTTGQVNVKFGGLINRVELIDVSGKVLLAVQGNQASYLQFDTGEVPSGIYLIQVISEDGHREVRKLSVR
ncbi:CotH kinase family protein [bacterium SCSIO 12741]|nr:CotH kinase family protein [bacterium SCSIO 12741]